MPCEITMDLHNHQPVFRHNFTDSSVKFNPFVELSFIGNEIPANHAFC